MEEKIKKQIKSNTGKGQRNLSPSRKLGSEEETSVPDASSFYLEPLSVSSSRGTSEV